MAKDPAFLFYSQDFYTGVAILNWEERGKFISILCLMHQQGRMKEETIRFLVGSVSDNLKSKFAIDDNGFWYNKRLEEESEKRAKFTESRRNNGLNGGRPPKTKSNAKPKNNHKVKHMDNHMEDDNVNENEIEIKEEIKDREEKFKETIRPFIGTYSKEMCIKFFTYWSEPNKTNTKMRFELEKTWEISRRLLTWSNNNKTFDNGKQIRKGQPDTSAALAWANEVLSGGNNNGGNQM